MTEYSPSPRAPISEILGIVRAMAVDLRLPGERLANLSQQTSLDRDLGLDSLSRVELISRVERHFNVTLGEENYTKIDTINELFDAIKRAPQTDKSLPHSATMRSVPGVPVKWEELPEVPVPQSATTLVEALHWHIKHHGSRQHMVICDDVDGHSSLTYQDLYEGATLISEGLGSFNIGHGDAVALMLPTCKDYFFSFFGIMLRGAIPVPVYPPTRPNQLEDHLQRHVEIFKNSVTKVLITTPLMAKGVGRLIKLKATNLTAITSPDELRSERHTAHKPPLAALGTNGIVNEKVSQLPSMSGLDTAFLQYTSGSTGNPKGVVLTHANILANIRAMGEALDVQPSDVFVSWLPLYHDMGLIGAWLGSLYFACRFVVMSPMTFLIHPYRWLETLHQYKGTLTAGPNFAYELCMRRILSEEISKLDLSHVRVMCNGAEAAMPETMENFSKRFEQTGLKREALMPVYGLAESSVGLSFPPLGRPPRFDIIDRDIFVKTGHAVNSKISDHRKLTFAGCGHPLRGHEIRIVDAGDREVAERHEGHLQFRGPSSTKGYLGNEVATRGLMHGTWLDSGDLAYWAEGDVFITGRVKDVIKHAGRNIYPEELEIAVGQLPGIRKGCIAAFGSHDSKIGTERLIIIAETRESDAGKLASIKRDVNSTVANLIGTPPDEVVLVPPHSVLKTSSGKIRRSACRLLFESGHIGASQLRIRWQMVRYIATAMPVQLRRALTGTMTIIRSLATYIAFVVIAIFVWPIVMIWPSLNGRWWILRNASRVVTFIAGIHIDIFGRENIPASPCIFIANHSSYIDAVIVTIALKVPAAFVTKSELGHLWLLRWTLKRLGVEFVERFVMRQGLADAKRLAEVHRKGRSLISFPEGTFTRNPGLLPFHIGPFLTAVETSSPIVPVAIKGTRSIMHPESSLIRRGTVEVRILPAIEAPNELKQEANPWDKTLRLRDISRRDILEFNGEPDLDIIRAVYQARTKFRSDFK